MKFISFLFLPMIIFHACAWNNQNGSSSSSRKPGSIESSAPTRQYKNKNFQKAQGAFEGKCASQGGAMFNNACLCHAKNSYINPYNEKCSQ